MTFVAEENTILPDWNACHSVSFNKIIPGLSNRQQIAAVCG
jgi:hypothetical protein